MRSPTLTAFLISLGFVLGFDGLRASDAPLTTKGEESSAENAAKKKGLKSFDEITKDFSATLGLFPIWSKDNKTFIEIPEDWFNKPFLFTINVAESIGEKGLYASQMGMRELVQWERHGDRVQLIALNTKFRASGEGALAVRQAFSSSLLTHGKQLSEPHPQKRSILLDANNLLMRDILGLSTELETAFRLPFSMDVENSRFTASRSDEVLTTLTAKNHYFVKRIPAPPPVFNPSAANPSPPRATPDPRSFFLSLVYSFRALPEKEMSRRLSDPRLGHFTESYTDLSDDRLANPRVHLIKRWRLEKADPEAALSQPKTPILIWLDKNIPSKVRPAVREGILEWNKAFERIGFKDAIVVKQQPDSADWDNMDAGHASVRWFVGSDVGFAIGPSHSDPRTGEILDADMGMSDVFGRGIRRLVSDDLLETSTDRLSINERGGIHGSYKETHSCNYLNESISELQFGLELLEARGLDPDSPEADRLVLEAIKDTMMHETGHILGLKHNFKASTTVSQKNLRDNVFTRERGTSGSVMDYNSLNLPLEGEARGPISNLALGPYDYWAIEYAYKVFDASEEEEALKRIAARGEQEPALAYADDMDAGRSSFDGFDPMSNRFDLGDDPLAWYKRRLQLSRELWQRIQERPVMVGEDPQKRRRSLMSGFRLLRRLPTDAAKYVGGMYAYRDSPGSLRPNYVPVSPERQKEALHFLKQEIFSVDSFNFRPEFLANLPPDYREWDRGEFVDIPNIILQTQADAMDRLMSSGTAKRVLDLPLLIPKEKQIDLITLADIYGSLRSAIWSELKSSNQIDRLRRNLQREHVKRLQLILIEGASPGLARASVSRRYTVSSQPIPMPTDAISLTRVQAKRLRTDIGKALNRKNLTFQTRAHLEEMLDFLNAMLDAKMTRR
jgi:hypothetical protein